MMHTSSSRFTVVGLGLAFGLVALMLMALAPVPHPTPENTEQVSGMVEAITSRCCGDVEIEREGDAHRYYINRGVEAGLDVAALRQRLIGQVVPMRVVDRSWSPLDPLHKMAPVVGLELDEEVLYTAPRP